MLRFTQGTHMILHQSTAHHSLLHPELPLGVANGNGYVIEDAESHWLVTLAVVAWRTRHSQTVVDLCEKDKCFWWRTFPTTEQRASICVCTWLSVHVYIRMCVHSWVIQCLCEGPDYRTHK